MVSFTFNSKVYEFRNPSLGNTDEIAFQRINRRSRGGDIIIFRDNEWPKTETLHLTFNFIKESDAHRLLTLVRDSLCSLLYYTDHESVVWQGFINNPDADITQTGRSGYQVPIVFEGDHA